MGITNVVKNTDDLSLTVHAQYDVTPERAWQLFADPRQLERWWGPPTWPATVVEHDMRVGGQMTYFMTGPDGTKAAGFWNFLAIDPPRRLEIQDGFADADGNELEGMPRSRMVVELAESPSGGTLVTIRSEFESTEAMQKLMDMGMQEGFTTAMGQIDDILVAV